MTPIEQPKEGERCDKCDHLLCLDVNKWEPERCHIPHGGPHGDWKAEKRVDGHVVNPSCRSELERVVGELREAISDGTPSHDCHYCGCESGCTEDKGGCECLAAFDLTTLKGSDDMPFIDHQPFKQECRDPQHNPPGMIVLPPGNHTWACPSCGNKVTISEPQVTC